MIRPSINSVNMDAIYEEADSSDEEIKRNPINEFT